MALAGRNHRPYVLDSSKADQLQCQEDTMAMQTLDSAPER